MPEYKLYQGDCLDILPTLEAGSVDAVIADPPYGTTACSWDTVIPFEPMWAGIKHVRKERAAVVLFGSEPFSSLLRVSNLREYKYDWVWDKSGCSNPQLAKIQPLKNTENIAIFGDGKIAYYPQGLSSDISLVLKRRGRNWENTKNSIQKLGHICHAETYSQEFTNYPKTIIKFPLSSTGRTHPTQKPVPLLEYLIKTYTNEGDTVLDFTMGSGTTGVACMRTGRNFIGVELDPEYFAIAETRIKNANNEFTLTEKEKLTGQMPLFT